MGNKEANAHVTLGLCPRIGEASFMGYDYLGGEGFGLSLDYHGQTRIDGEWTSPSVFLTQTGAEVYEALDAHVAYLQASGCMPERKRTELPEWWKKPIFGGWGEQVFHSNRWFLNEAHLDVATDLWPDLKGFIRDQHAKGRKVILWVSPFGYCKSSKGKDVPLMEHMFVDEDDLFEYEIDTDVFYPAIGREHKKVRKNMPLPAPTLTDAHWRYVADPQNPAYVKRLKAKVRELLSPEGYDADGFEFDYTHFLPKFRGTKPVTPREEKTRWGVEALHGMIKLFHESAKEVKEDALIISHTFNPFFNDVVDMLRLQDIYTDRRSIVAQMDHRAQIAHRVAPGCVVHTDQHPMPSLEAWREYAKFQPRIGNPCTYYSTGIETTRETFTEEDFSMLKSVWDEYNLSLKK